MNKYRNPMTQTILDLTLEIIYLLTGEDHLVVKIHRMENSGNQVSEGNRRIQSPGTVPPPRSLIHERHNDQKILELTNQIIHLLTGEVPIRCEDVTVHLSMEEWEYVERHKELYKDVMMEDHQPDESVSGEFDSLVSSSDFGTENGEKYLNPITKVRDESTTVKEEESLGFEERHVPGRDFYPPDVWTEYPPPDIKEEPASWEEGNLSDIDVYKPPEHTQTQCVADHFTDYLNGFINPMGMNLNESFNTPRKPDRRIYHEGDMSPLFIINTDLAPYVVNGYSAPSELEKVSYCQSDLVVRETKYRGEGIFSSSDYGEHFTLRSALENQNFHTEEQSFSCSECEERFTDRGALRKHQRVHGGQKQFKCTVCKKSFPWASSLARHKKTHTGHKPFKCSECGKCFSRNDKLTRHQRTHTGEKPFGCTVCGKCFTQASSLARHTMIHTGEKPYKCSECGTSFTFKTNLNQHLKYHSGEFKCTECGKGFIQSSDLASHKIIHTGEKPFSCAECGKCFNRKHHLSLHQKVHTGKNKEKCTLSG